VIRMSGEIRDGWTARKDLRFDFVHINDESWRTSVRTIEQLGVPGLEGDVWRIELEESRHGISEAAMKVFRADFDMEYLLEIMNKSEDLDLFDEIEVSARSFYAEAQFNYNHTNILKPYAFGRIANRNVILMPVVEGDNLTDYIRKNPDLPMEARLKLCHELCIAVSELHELGNYLHNDIKPDNIMVSLDSSGMPSLTLIDMGFSCSIPDVETIYGDVKKPVGTEGYIAPEVRRGSARWVSPASDVWSVGCTLFFVLTSLELVTGVLDHKSEESQNELYESLLGNMSEPLIRADRMARAGIDDEGIAAVLEVLLTPAMNLRRSENRPLQKMAYLCSGSSIDTTSMVSEPAVSTGTPPVPAEGLPSGWTMEQWNLYGAQWLAEPRPTSVSRRPKTAEPILDDEMRKVILRPEGGMKQIILLKNGVERYIRHQHVPQVDTSSTKLIRLIFDSTSVYAFPRSGLNCKINGNPWTEQQIITSDSSLEIEGVSIQIEIR
jgi:serine/threonine protein kinase